jgi:hypothetical protein
LEEAVSALLTFALDHYTLFLGVVIAAILIWKSAVIVQGTEIAVVERRYLGVAMPKGRVVAMSNEVGVQARTLGPGLHFLIPFDVSDGQQGMGTRRHGDGGISAGKWIPD